MLEVAPFSGWAPSASAAGSWTRKGRISNGCPPMKLVAVDWKNCCCSVGAWKPVETVARIANCSLGAKRPDSLPVVSLPKSL